MKPCIRYSSMVMGISFLGLAVGLKMFNLALIGILFIYVNNIVYCFENIKQRIYLLMFHVTIFVFLLSRPTISMFRGEIWWGKYDKEHIVFSLISITLSLLGLFVGGNLGRQLLKGKTQLSDTKIQSEDNAKFVENLQKVAGIIFYISIVFYMILQMEKLIFMNGKEYVEYYTSFKSRVPTVIHLGATFMQYSLCIFLATKPKKIHAFPVLALYVLSAVPDLLVGIRNPIMLRTLFAFLYYFIRDVLGGKEKWIGRSEKLLMVIGTPCILAFMGAYSYIRSGMVSGKNFIKLLIDFFYGQGVSFEVLSIGHSCIPLLPERAFRNYTFGGIIDYFMHGSIAQRLFEAKALDSGNTLTNALESNSFAHNMSYISKGKEYLQGHGWGSSYILEVFTDYGYIGLIIFNIVLGIVLVWLVKLLMKNTFMFTMVLLATTNIFFAPRAEATGWLDFAFTIQFWLVMGLVYLIAALCTKNYRLRKERRKCLNVLD